MRIELTRDKCAIIDTIDEDLAGRSWHAVPGHRSVGNYTFYAARRRGSKRADCDPDGVSCSDFVYAYRVSKRCLHLRWHLLA